MMVKSIRTYRVLVVEVENKFLILFLLWGVVFVERQWSHY